MAICEFLKPRGFGLAIGLAVAIHALVGGPGATGVHTALARPSEDTTALRTATPLMNNWKFRQDDSLTDSAALRSTAASWQTVSLPHTWNAIDAASNNTTMPYKRGIGWYQLEFDTPAVGARHWLEFGAASIVADVWLNGQKLGEHKGAFTAFRFDVTDRLSRRGRNVLLVKANNSAPTTIHDLTAIIPVSGDFNYSGGLYRNASLISTPDSVHFDLGDLGGPGVYATTTSIAGANATVNVRARLASDARENGEYTVHIALLDAGGRVASSADRTTSLTGGGRTDVTQALSVKDAHLWRGVDDPYLYTLVADLVKNGKAIDRVVQQVGIRQMRFDPNRGFFLNGKHIPLHGVAMEGDYYHKGWALSDHDIETSMAFVKELGANTVRFGHYKFNPHFYALADKMGLVVWAEVPFVYGVDVVPFKVLGAEGAPTCPTQNPSDTLWNNATLQLRETIRQLYDHASVAIWSVGNESTYQSRSCTAAPYDNITPLMHELDGIARREDSSRVTSYADFEENVTPPLQGGYISTGGITETMGINQYYLWYSGPVVQLGQLLDAVHARYPNQPLGMTEYGGGGALTHHTDNPLGGPAESNNPGVPVVYQPEEYQAYVHEQNYAMLQSKGYMWGTYAWVLFDFGTAARNEGDVLGVNTKGLVTFDRKTRKDAFYFYKANWSKAPVVHIVGRRYTNRAYPVADVKVYTNADSMRLSVNGTVAGSMRQAQCLLMTCVIRNVKLGRGADTVVAAGYYRGRSMSDSMANHTAGRDTVVSDTVAWQMTASDINITAGQLETGFTSSTGARFGSDNFFIGGVGDWLVNKNTKPVADSTPVRGTPDANLYKNYRHSQFSYDIPLEDGRYEVTLGFLEPDRITDIGNRVFDVAANGEVKIENLDVLRAAGGRYRTAVTRRFTTTVSGGHLKLDFIPEHGEAVVSNIAIHRVGASGAR